ncbi:diguanylate cyclase [Amphritea sp. 2_MG-2023]|jgi:diguanylate cyclase|uniref:GGDEF domain-containing protein n=1 Tax=Amphritea TaxID=515417 RepID=UPI001C0695CF|nr:MULTISPECIES: diguanylate cyclase [Amphritea]MBU2964471.1 diguanylate cyclase [Amphritea atlantica]MDO6417799.1 diguanylate cyclase [Amphritea sp. 2_MG-2023]
MKFADNSHQATEYLRQVIPLMVHNVIPPTPLNYALWYAYVSKSIPKLNQQMDKVLEIYGTCPNRVSEQLFSEYLIKDEAANSEVVQRALLSVMGDLESSASSTVQDTEAYNEILQDSLAALKTGNDTKSLEAIIQNLSANTESISESTRQFQAKIDDAQSEITKLKQELDQSRQDATIDPLTGLFNRRVFDQEISEQAAKPEPDVSLIMIDIDFFKKFNDTYGHQMGDKVLQYVAKLIKEACTEPLIPVRFGGEEFSMLLPGMNVTDACELAEKVRHRIAAIRIKQKKSGEVISSVTASFGVARLSSDESPDNLIARADAALYKAKEAGRNNVQIAD